MAHRFHRHLDLERRARGEMRPSIVASAIIFFSTGDHVVDVALPDLPAALVDRHRDARRGGADGRRQAEAS